MCSSSVYASIVTMIPNLSIVWLKCTNANVTFLEWAYSLNCSFVRGFIGLSAKDLYRRRASATMCSQNLLMQSFPLYSARGLSILPYANSDLTHHPDGVCKLIPQVDDFPRSFDGPCIGSRKDSKSVYIMNGTLNWNCPFEYCTIGL